MTIDRLLAQLAAPDLYHRIEADAALHDPQYAARLTALVQAVDQPAEARWRAAVILGAIGARDSVDALIAALTDPSWDVRHSAAWSLGALRDPRGFDALYALVMSAVKDEQIPYVAAIGLLQIDPVRGLSAVQTAAQHVDPTVMSIARSALTGQLYR